MIAPKRQSRIAQSSGVADRCGAGVAERTVIRLEARASHSVTERCEIAARLVIPMATTSPTRAAA